MLIVPRTKFVEKIITSQEGVDFKVLFLVYEEAGRIKAKVISAIPVSVNLSKKESPIALPNFSQFKRVIEEVIVEKTSKIIPSPYNSILYFNCTIPRAPAKNI
ncbi:MAG: hypothetical protein WCO18_01595 [bacterium]